MIKKKLLTAIMSLISMLTAVAQKNVIDGVIWVVGDETILRSDVERQRQIMQTEGMRFEGDPYCFIPEQLALQKLFLSQAKIDSIVADEGNVIRYVDRFVNYQIMQYGSQEKYEEYNGGKKLNQIKEEHKVRVREMQIQQEMQNKIVGEIKLRPSDVTKYFNQISKDSLPTIPTMVEVEIIMMEPFIPIEDIDALKAQLRTITEKIYAEEFDFTFAARRYSEDEGTVRNGGQTGFRSKIELAPEYATAAFALNDPKRVSNVVQTEYGYHIIQLIEKRGDRINTRHVLLRPKVSEQELNRAITRLDSLRTDIVAGKFTFEEAAILSSDKDTRNNHGLMVNKDEESRNFGASKFEMEELPQGMGIVVDNMQVGEISKPFRMKNSAENDVVAIVKLKSRVLVHQANMQDDFLEIKTLVENQKREEILKEWIISKQKSTFIKISDGWCDCDFRYPGWIKE